MNRINLGKAFLFGLLFALAGCREARPLLNDGEIPPDTLITLERTVCFGSCPNYSVSIKANGAVTFVGEEYVEVTGTVRSAISEEQVRELLLAFQTIDYFSLEDHYDTENIEACERFATDMPSAITSLTVNGETKTVEHYFGCEFDGEDELYALETLIDEIAHTVRWVGE